MWLAHLAIHLLVLADGASLLVGLKLREPMICLREPQPSGASIGKWSRVAGDRLWLAAHITSLALVLCSRH